MKKSKMRFLAAFKVKVANETLKETQTLTRPAERDFNLLLSEHNAVH